MRVPFYQFVFALFCVLGGYRVVYLHILPENMLLPCLVAVVACAVIYGLVVLAVKDVHKSAMITSMSLVGFFSFSGFYEALKMALPGSMMPDQLVVCAIYLVLLLVLLVPFIKRSKDWSVFTPGLNIAAVLLLVVNLIEPTAHVLDVNSRFEQCRKSLHDQAFSWKVKDTQDRRPDIYYIVVDAFANPQTLKEVYDYDDGAFLNFLRERKFYVAQDARSNYDRTMLSFASFLNLDYLGAVGGPIAKSTQDCQFCYRLAQNSTLLTYLRDRLGYKIINLSSGYDPTNQMPSAEKNIGYGLGSAFFIGLSGLTLYSPFENHLHFLRNLYLGNRLTSFAKAGEIASIPGPKFVLEHCEFPHPPFVIDAEGKELALSPKLMSEDYTKERYLGQLQFTENQLEKLVGELLSRPGQKPVIIIHSDHGPALTPDKSSPQYDRERMRILLAVYFPDEMYDELYPSMSLVNLGRAVLNHLFGAELSRLPDRSYVSPDNYPFDFADVTQRLNKEPDSNSTQ